MKTRITLFCLLFIASLQILTAKNISPETAKLVAVNKLHQVDNSLLLSNLTLVYTSDFINTEIDDENKNTALFYVFNVGNNHGFIIISADNSTYPVLGYAKKGNFDTNIKAGNFKKWIENYKNQIEYIITNHLQASNEIKNQWNELINNTNTYSNRNFLSVNPLVSTTWSQSPYYNDMCPADSRAGSSNGYHAVTGCPATAMAQIMKYWNYPTHGTGFHSYNHPDYGTLSANFSATTYDWASMPNSVTSTNNAVATLMYHCGVGVEMQYGPHSSGSYVIIDNAYYSQERTSEYAYKTYFGYDASSIQGIKRANYSDYDWIQLMKNELNAGRPVQYAGFGAGGGHTFVCDGYDNNNYFHMNWGWGGMYDGFFLLNALSPGTGGTGAGAGSYNDGQQAVIGIKPPSGTPTSYDLRLYEDITVTPASVSFGQSFSVYTNIGNWGSTNFSGDFCAAIFDEDHNFVDFVGEQSGVTLGGGYYLNNGLTFSNSGISNAFPGTYYVGIFYRPTGGDWVVVSDNASHVNMKQFRIIYQNDIELYQDMLISTGSTITNGQAFTVTLDIINNGTTTYNGDFNVSLYKLDGSYVTEVQTLTNGTLSAGYYYDDVQFSTSGINITPGTYYLALMHKPNGGNWQMVGSTNYNNPVRVIVRAAGLTADAYENNDSPANAYNFPLSFSSNNANALTTGSNLHVNSDQDYYKIVLPAGYDYTINARVHDSYDSGNGQTYTCDVAWAYNLNNTWSSSYDTGLPAPFVVHNGGTVYFYVAPYFTGQKGTYLLDINISRGTAGIKTLNSDQIFTLFPNPSIDKVNVELKNIIDVNSIKIMDVNGKEILNVTQPVFNKNSYSLPVSNLKNGTYILLMYANNHVWQTKFIKTK